MNNLQVDKWNYLEEDVFHMKTVANKLKKFAFSIDQNEIKQLISNGENFKKEHYNSELEKNVYWYGAKIYIIAFLDEYCMGGKRNLISKNPALVTGMFMQLADTFNYTTSEFFYPRLFIYEMAADFVQYYEATENNELNEKLVKEFFLFFSEYLINSIYDDKSEEEFTNFFKDHNISFEYGFLEENKNQYLYFAYGSNMDKIQMDQRTPGAVPIGISKKINYRTILNERGVATIIPERGSISYGILWRVSNDHIKTLDIYEGVQYGTYKKVNSSVIIAGYQYPALVYIAKNDKVGLPRRLEYLDTLLRGIKYFNGHTKWYNEIKKLGYLQTA